MFIKLLLHAKYCAKELEERPAFRKLSNGVRNGRLEISHIVIMPCHFNCQVCHEWEVWQAMREDTGKPAQEGSSEGMTFEWGPEGKVGITSSSFRKTGTLGGLSKEMWTRSFLGFAWSLISSYNHYTKLFRLYWRVWVTKKNIGGKTLTHTSDVTASKRKSKPFTEDRSLTHSSSKPWSHVPKPALPSLTWTNISSSSEGQNPCLC